MTTTAKDLITAAYAHRTANDPDKLATKGELVSVLSRKLRAIYARAHEANPYFFSKTAEVVGVGGTWDRPEDAARVLWIYSGADPVAGRVRIVPFRDIEAELPPRLYQLGLTFHPTGHDADPSGTDPLTFVYAFTHPDLDPVQLWDTEANTLDESWPEHYNDILVLRIAKYLAAKDGRAPTELAALEAEHTELLALFDLELARHLRETTRWAG